MIRRPPRSTPLYSSAASDVYKRQPRRYVDSTPISFLPNSTNVSCGEYINFPDHSPSGATRQCVRLANDRSIAGRSPPQLGHCRNVLLTETLRDIVVVWTRPGSSCVDLVILARMSGVYGSCHPLTARYQVLDDFNRLLLKFSSDTTLRVALDVKCQCQSWIIIAFVLLPLNSAAAPDWGCDHPD